MQTRPGLAVETSACAVEAHSWAGQGSAAVQKRPGGQQGSRRDLSRARGLPALGRGNGVQPALRAVQEVTSRGFGDAGRSQAKWCCAPRRETPREEGQTGEEVRVAK